MREPSRLLWIVTAALLFLSCESERDKNICTQALFDGRVLTKRGDLEQARDKLRVAEEKCDARRHTYVQQLRQDIVSKEEALEKQRQAEAREQEQRRDLPVAAFTKWVEKRREAADKSEEEVECYPRDDPQFGWCETTKRIDEDLVFRTRYWRTDSDVYRFAVTVDKPIVCDDLGPHRVVGSWRTDGVERTHCEFSSKALRDLSALISVEGDQSKVEVFPSDFVAKDAGFRRKLEEKR